MRKIKVDPIREIILDILVKMESDHGYINILLNDTLKKKDIRKRDAAFIQEITYGVARNQIKMDWVISLFASKKIKKMQIIIRNIIRMSIYQMIELHKIPDYAVCNEAVQLAKKYGNENSANFVNAILRNIIRKKSEIAWPDVAKNRAVYLSVLYSHPLWIIQRWLKKHGYTDTLKICKTNNTIPPLTIRTNTLKINRSTLKKHLEEKGYEVERGKYSEEALYIHGMPNVTEHDDFKKGLFQIQDESSILVSHLLGPLPGEYVMDICSAPGGKTTHLAQLMNNEGVVVSVDINKTKIKTIQKNCQRLGINIVKAIQHDAIRIKKEFLGAADKLLVDAPCSCLGILRRKPDIKLREFNKKRILQLSNMQKQILLTSSNYLKVGGILVYTTCSTEIEENEDVIHYFLQNKVNFKLEKLNKFNKRRHLTDNLSGEDDFIKIYPGISNSKLDGFFMARMIRKE